jgi:hypothetical protein
MSYMQQFLNHPFLTEVMIIVLTILYFIMIHVIAEKIAEKITFLTALFVCVALTILMAYYGLKPL